MKKYILVALTFLIAVNIALTGGFYINNSANTVFASEQGEAEAELSSSKSVKQYKMTDLDSKKLSGDGFFWNKEKEIYPFRISKKNTVYIKIKNDSALNDGKIIVSIVNYNGKKVLEKKISAGKTKIYKITLSKGKYKIKLSGLGSEEEYSYCYDISAYLAKRTIKKTLYSCDTYVAVSNFGSGSWSTSNKSVAGISVRKGKKCVITAKNKGKATVTYKKGGVVYKYVITVKSPSYFPLRKGYISVNSAGGVEPSLYISNNSGKTIKYIDFDAYFYNTVGDPAYCSIYGTNIRSMQIVGPIKPYKSGWFCWDPVIYNGTTGKMYVGSITITYTDGTTKNINVKRSYICK